MWRFVAIFLFISCLLHCQLVYAKNCTVSEFKSTKTGLCCQLCPAGEYLTKECTQDAETLCEACPAKYFTSNPNSLTSCQKCSSSIICDGGRILKHNCTRTSDIQCECSADKYFNTHTLRCEDCTVCSRGEKVISPCQAYQDASCEACPKGTYLDSQNNICVLCSYCKKGEVVKEECAIWADTKCGKEQVLPTKKSNPVVLSISTQVTHPELPTSTESRSQKDNATKPADFQEQRVFSDVITWFSIGLNILLLCVIAILSWPRITRGGRKLKLQTPNGNVGTTKAKASVVSTSNSSETIKESNIKITTLPVTVTEELALLLNSKQGNNWKHLAGLMGYNSVFTQNLDLTPLEATQRLLEDWGHKDDATVYKLYCFLKELGRDDACSKLWPSLTQRGEGEELV